MPDPVTRPDDVTSAVLASFEGCDNPRLRQVLQSFARHLHEFVREVGLREDEWATAITLLRQSGDLTDDNRNEFILWSDTLGVSMLVDVLSHDNMAGGTESTILGPFYVPEAPLRDYGASIATEAVGVPAWVHGRLLDPEGVPIADAELDVWQNGDDMLYAVQSPEHDHDHLRGRFRTRADGSYAFLGVRPVDYPIPADGPVGAMLTATGRHPWRPAHIHMIVRASGYRPLVTHIFDGDSPYLSSDAVFAVRPSLLRSFVERAPDDPARPAGVEGPWVSMENDIVLVPDPSGHPA
jgi:hydroxyquinol 1,2-dioxygenase